MARIEVSYWPNPAAPVTDSSGSYWGKTGRPCHCQSRQFLTQTGVRCAATECPELGV
jgi:hypothetical protein